MVREAEVKTDWQPIETAPKDCDKLILWCPIAGPRGKGAIVFGRTYGMSGGRTEVRGEGMLGDWQFTHWLPLPAPPDTP